jgi:hypothetical protein
LHDSDGFKHYFQFMIGRMIFWWFFYHYVDELFFVSLFFYFCWTLLFDIFTFYYICFLFLIFWLTKLLTLYFLFHGLGTDKRRSVFNLYLLN